MDFYYVYAPKYARSFPIRILLVRMANLLVDPLKIQRTDSTTTPLERGEYIHIQHFEQTSFIKQLGSTLIVPAKNRGPTSPRIELKIGTICSDQSALAQSHPSAISSLVPLPSP